MLESMALRETHLERLRTSSFDVLVVGGGINGAVTAASLAGRGASVALIDRSDFASFTSQESSNLVWGGFKYLENYEFPLVFNLCRSRNRLMKAYPDNIKEIGFLAALDGRRRTHRSSPRSARWATGSSACSVPNRRAC
jgi:glycerol-3-phosphate dehydrogenase